MDFWRSWRAKIIWKTIFRETLKYSLSGELDWKVGTRERASQIIIYCNLKLYLRQSSYGPTPTLSEPEVESQKLSTWMFSKHQPEVVCSSRTQIFWWAESSCRVWLFSAWQSHYSWRPHMLHWSRGQTCKWSWIINDNEIFQRGWPSKIDCVINIKLKITGLNLKKKLY